MDCSYFCISDMANGHTNEMLVGPDGGWGWVIVLAAFVVQFMAGGLVQSFSPLYIALRRYFNSSAEDTSWVVSILSCLIFLMGKQ